MQAILSSAPECRGLARRELEQALSAGCALEELSAGTWLLSAPGRFADLARLLWRTTFVRHACPVSAEVPAPADAAPAAWAEGTLLPAALRLPGLRPRGGAPVQVQVRVLPGAPTWHPGGLAAAVRVLLEAEGIAAVGGPAPAALSVVVADGRAFVGCGPVSENLSPWPGGVARLRAGTGELARSARKLEEALEVFGLRLPPGGRALDLGAAPGGWSKLLLDRGLSVVAIDTGELHPSLAGAPGLTFMRGSALTVPVPPGPFHLLAADLSWDPLRAAACALRFRPSLAPQAAGVFTVKFFGGDPLEIVARVRRRLEEGGFQVAAVRHLFHNRAEAMALLRT